MEWDYIDVRRLAVLTDNEIKEFERKISKNYLIKAMGIQECPKCNSMKEETKSISEWFVQCAVRLARRLTSSAGIVFESGPMTLARKSVVGIISLIILY